MIEFIIAILLIVIVALVARIQDLRRKNSGLHRHAVEVGNANARLMIERGEAAIELHRLEEILRRHNSDILTVRRMAFALSAASDPGKTSETDAPVEWPEEIDTEVEING